MDTSNPGSAAYQRRPGFRPDDLLGSWVRQVSGYAPSYRMINCAMCSPTNATATVTIAIVMVLRRLLTALVRVLTLSFKSPSRSSICS